MMTVNSYITVKYVGPDDPLALKTGQVYRARVLKPTPKTGKHWYGIIDESYEEYAYPPDNFVLFEEEAATEENRFLIIGCPGAGKSTFAKQLGRKTGIPVFHLDDYWFRKDGSNVSVRDFIRQVSPIIDKERWIIDGTYLRTIDKRIRACDTVFFFDIPEEECLRGIENREDCSDELRQYVKNYNEEKRPEILDYLKRYSNKRIVVFHSREEAEEFLKKKT